MKHFYKQFFLCLLALATTAFSFAQTVIDFESQTPGTYFEAADAGQTTASYSGFDFTIYSTSTTGGVYYGFDRDNPSQYPESIGYNSVYMYLGTMDGSPMTEIDLTRTGGGPFDFNKITLSAYPSVPDYDVPFDIYVQGFKNNVAVTTKVALSTVIKGQGGYGVAVNFDLSGNAGFKGVDKVVITTSISNDYMAVDNVNLEPLDVTSVDLKWFRGRLTGNTVSFNWASGVETNFDHYELQRSLNNNAFSAVGQIAAKGDEQQYQTSITQTAARAYYRLKLVDRGGAVNYSKVITVDHKNDPQGIFVYPNPATQYIHVYLLRSGILNIYNGSGKKVLTRALKTGNNDIDVAGLAAGIYYGVVNGFKVSFVKK